MKVVEVRLLAGNEFGPGSRDGHGDREVAGRREAADLVRVLYIQPVLSDLVVQHADVALLQRQLVGVAP